ncbi:hypothetical protein OS242_09290 [Tumebacillus sp. DT12]|uniref:YetF C-terminal domain-containing protein n=1 Tax=Tumebacillus lacus TaxID=2995335 RepID=A0ABT3X2Y3_9BACL|nr:hypothetical protein [Tumebacillus lacus]MCX7570157.1 hypothetical protein [Tumebacillus lacus]
MEEVQMPLCLIRQGRTMYDNLMKIGKSEPWLRETLSQLQIYDVRDVRYALLDPNGSVHVLYA